MLTILELSDEWILVPKFDHKLFLVVYEKKTFLACFWLQNPCVSTATHKLSESDLLSQYDFAGFKNDLTSTLIAGTNY